MSLSTDTRIEIIEAKLDILTNNLRAAEISLDTALRKLYRTMHVEDRILLGAAPTETIPRQEIDQIIADACLRPGSQPTAEGSE